MALWKKISGHTELEIISAEPEAMLQALNDAGIEIQNIKPVKDLTYRIMVRRRDCAKTIRLCGQRGENVYIIHKYGLFFDAFWGNKRPILILGAILLVLILLILPNRILFVKVNGNMRIPERRIIEVAQRCGIDIGASRRQVRSEQVKNALLSAVPELQWAGVNTEGCVAKISVRERNEEEEKEDGKGVVSIVAGIDGYVLWSEAEKGTILTQPGEAVEEGQTLISGYVDCGSHVQVDQAKGEVYAQTDRTITVVMPAERKKRSNKIENRKKYSLLIGKKRINLWKDSGILDSSCGRMYEEYYVTLLGGFYLPIALCVDSYCSYETMQMQVPPEEAEDELAAFAKKHLGGQMIAGVISSERYLVTEDNGVFRLDGDYVCTEMIGRERKEKIGDTNGKNS